MTTESDAQTATPQTILIRALPINNAAPQFPSPPFTISCAASNANCATNPEVGDTVTFDASGVTDEAIDLITNQIFQGVPCNTCTFVWNFGNDGTAVGQVVSHTFNLGGSYTVAVRVTDPAGSTSVAQRTVTVLGH